jgi:hypothetical protein
MPVNIHRAGGGRNRGEPTARHRNPRGCGHRVAGFFGSFLSRLLAYRRDCVPAGISNCRCSKRKQEDNGYATNRPTAQASKPDRGCHGSIVRLFTCKNKKKLQTGGATRSLPKLSLPKGNVPDAGDRDAPLLLRSDCRRRRRGSDKWRPQIPTSHLPLASARR